MIRLSSIRSLVAGAALVGASAAQASAQINFIGVTTYGFAAAGTTANTVSYSSTASLLGLTIAADPSSGFNVTTLAMGPNAGAVSISTAGNSIGRITLAGGNYDYSAQTNRYLYIQTIFSTPNGTPTSQYFIGRLTGNTTASTSALNLSFTGSNRVGSVTGVYSVGPYTAAAGSNYDYTINTHELALGETIQDGRIEEEHFIPTSGVPEPASMVLLATGLVGVGAVARRRNKKA